MAPYVLIPGMWHGGWCWTRVTARLRAAGHDVYPVTLTGLGERAHLPHTDIDSETHIRDVVGVLEYEDLHGVILVGHSLGGSLAPAVADRVPERVAHIVNLDGPILADRMSFRDIMPDVWADFRQRAVAAGDEGWLPPIPEWTFGVAGADLAWLQSKLTPHPLRTWETPLSLANAMAASLPRTFIHCTEGASPDEIAHRQQDCAGRGWAYRSLPTGHDAMITLPGQLADLLLELAGHQ